VAKKIGEILVERGLLTPQLVAQGLEAQRFYGGRVGSLWLEMGVLEEKALVEALCEQKHAHPVKAGLLKSVGKTTLDLIPVKVAVRHQVIPLARDNRRLTVALTDPNDLLALDELSFITGCVIEPLLATERTILNGLEKYYGITRKKRDTVEVDGVRAAAAAYRASTARQPDAADAPAPEATPQEPPEVTEELLLDDAAGKQAAREFWAGSGPPPPRVVASPPVVAAREPVPDAAALPSPPVLAAGAASATDEIPDGNELLVEEGEATAVVAEAPRTIEEASRRLARVEIRDDIADVILWCTEELFARSALFIFQKSRTLGWTGQGRGLRPDAVRKVVLPIEDVSIFTIARDTRSHYLGPLPKTPGNEKLASTLGGAWPAAVLAIPFGVKGRPIGCFYAEDAVAELEAVDVSLMFRLLQKAGLAMELLLIRSKIVML
jgi:hypothetical protein